MRAKSWMVVLSAAAAGAAWADIASAADVDPMKSPVWDTLAAKYLDGAPFVHDQSVKVTVPSIVEDQAQVPVTADARSLTGVTKLVIIADLNPIQRVLMLSPAAGAQPYLSVRIKAEQGTPVRAAALAGDGVWHVGSVYLDAAGGGCSAPALARKDADWTASVGRSQGRIWRQPRSTARLRLRVRHPMDTGLAKDGTPAFFIETVEVKDEAGAGLARLDLYEPVAEDPMLTLELRLPAMQSTVTVEGRDNNGGIFRATIPVPPAGAAPVSQ